MVSRGFVDRSGLPLDFLIHYSVSGKTEVIGYALAVDVMFWVGVMVGLWRITRTPEESAGPN